MITFFIDVFHDLRERRLWPVAVGLVAGLLAIPIVLLKPVPAPAPGSTAAPSATATVPLPVVSVESGPLTGSRLQTFSAHNPFKPLADVAQPVVLAKAASSSHPSSAAPAPAAVAGSTPPSPSSTSASKPPATPPAAKAPSAGATQGKSTTRTAYFRFSPELRFGAPGHLKTMKRVKLLTLLPSAKQPVVAFMGVSSDYRSATFFLSDPGFHAQGKGHCNAAGAACRFIKLTLDRKHDSEKFVSADGRTTYDLKLVRIVREKLTPNQAKGRSTDVKPHAKSAGASRMLANLLTLSSVVQQSSSAPPAR